jgi:short-subunit dehydrogenase
MENARYTNLTVVITGATSAFGRGSALRFAAGGAAVVLAGRREDLLIEVGKECEAVGGRMVAIPTDVTEESEVEQLARTAAREFGRIDVWVNNAGSGAIGSFADVPLEDHIRVVRTDLLGTIFGSYFALRQFRRQGAGVLINVASVVGKVPAPYLASYVAAKYGVVGLGAALRQELQEAKVTSIHVCTLMPATFDTPVFEQYTSSNESTIPPVNDSNDVVEAIVGLATDPQDELSVGSAAKVSVFAHQFFPGLVESYMAKETHKAERQNAAPGREPV